MDWVKERLKRWVLRLKTVVDGADVTFCGVRVFHSWTPRIEPRWPVLQTGCNKVFQIVGSRHNCPYVATTKYANSAFPPSWVGIWVAIHDLRGLLSWRSLNGRPGLHTAVWLQAKVRVCGLGLWHKQNPGFCLWHTATLQSNLLTCVAMFVPTVPFLSAKFEP